MALPEDSLRKLPQGAQFSKKNGRATATVANQGGRLVVTAQCDSLLQLTTFYQRTLEASKQETDSMRRHSAESAARTAKEQRFNCLIIAVFFFLAGLATGFITYNRLSRN